MIAIPLLAVLVAVVTTAVVAYRLRTQRNRPGAARKPASPSPKLANGVVIPPPPRVAIALPNLGARTVFVDPGLNSNPEAAPKKPTPPEVRAPPALAAKPGVGEGDRRLVEVPSSDPAQRRTEAVDPRVLQQVLARHRAEKASPAAKRKTPPPPPVPSSELPAPSTRTESAYFSQTTREGAIPPGLLERTLPPLGAVTEETKAPALRQAARPIAAEPGPTREVHVPEVKRAPRTSAGGMATRKTPTPSDKSKALASIPSKTA